MIEELLQKIKFVLECKNEAQAKRILEQFIFDQEEKSKQKCNCKKATFTRSVDADFNCLCGKCGRPI